MLIYAKEYMYIKSSTEKIYIHLINSEALLAK